MAYGSGTIAKGKKMVLYLSGFGTGLDGIVEVTSNGLPDMSENETDEFETNYRSIKDSIENSKWEDYSKAAFFYDGEGIAWKAAVKAKKAGTTGTLAFGMFTGTGTRPSLDLTLKSFKGKITSIESPEASVDEVIESFSPTFTILEELS